MSSRLSKVADWEKLADDARYKPETMASVCSVTLRQLERFIIECQITAQTNWKGIFVIVVNH